MTTELDRPQFSVAVFWDDGSHEYIVRLVRVEQAAIAFRNCVAVAEHPRAVQPPARVIITDGGDCIAREWTLGQGITIGDGK